MLALPRFTGVPALPCERRGGVGTCVWAHLMYGHISEDQVWAGSTPIDASLRIALFSVTVSHRKLYFRIERCIFSAKNAFPSDHVPSRCNRLSDLQKRREGTSLGSCEPAAKLTTPTATNMAEQSHSSPFAALNLHIFLELLEGDCSVIKI